MSMTKKHYKAIAKAITEATVVPTSGNLNHSFLVKAKLIADLAVIFKQDNPSFSYEKFVEACYPKTTGEL